MLYDLIASFAARFSRPLAAGGRTQPAASDPFQDTRPATGPHWLGRLTRSAALAPVPDPLQRLATVREDFSIALSDIPTQHASFLLHRIGRARSLRELWHMRAEIFCLMAVHFNEEEAERRMATLNRHFPTRSPRSGFVPLAD